MPTCPRCRRRLPEGATRCTCRSPAASSSQRPSATAAPAAPPPAGPRVRQGNRKACDGCGVDVTFSRDRRLEGGRWFCAACGLEKAEAEALLAANALPKKTTAKPPAEGEMRPATRPPPMGPIPGFVPKPRVPAVEPPAKRRSDVRSAVGIGVLVLVGVLAVALNVSKSRPDISAADSTVLQEEPAEPRPTPKTATQPTARAIPENPRRPELPRPNPTEVEARRLAAVRSSPAFIALQDFGRRIRNAGMADSLGDDSAYRAAGAAAEMNFILIATLTRQQALLHSLNVDDLLRRIDSAHDAAMAGEDSAVRAIYKHDRATVAALGVLASVWTDDIQTNQRLAGLQKRFSDDADALVRYDDSAPRAIQAYNDAVVSVWGLLAVRREVDPTPITNAATRLKAGNTSAWQAADIDADAQARIALLVLRRTQPAAADRIERAMEREAAGETSAIRSLAAKKRTLGEVLLALISHG